jgi:hypothetical protein
MFKNRGIRTAKKESGRVIVTLKREHRHRGIDRVPGAEINLSTAQAEGLQERGIAEILRDAALDEN